MPTLGEFVQVAVSEKYGWRLGKTPGMGPRGPAKIRYLIRDDKPLVDLQGLKDNDRLSKNTVESLCRRTGVLREEFGLEGEPPPEPDASDDLASEL